VGFLALRPDRHRRFVSVANGACYYRHPIQ
jgi:hypothetical protein